MVIKKSNVIVGIVLCAFVFQGCKSNPSKVESADPESMSSNLSSSSVGTPLSSSISVSSSGTVVSLATSSSVAPPISDATPSSVSVDVSSSALPSSSAIVSSAISSSSVSVSSSVAISSSEVFSSSSVVSSSSSALSSSSVVLPSSSSSISSSSSLSSSSSGPHIPVTGTFTDVRDGQTYGMVEIGDQTWMSENLNYDVGSGSYCFNRDPAQCLVYGRLYEWDIAMDGAAANDTLIIKGICPIGWHIPSVSMWWKMADYVATQTGLTGHTATDWEEIGSVLKATSGWANDGNGTDDFGFNGLPGGFRTTNGNYNSLGEYGTWQSASGDGAATASGPSVYSIFSLLYKDDIFDLQWQVSDDYGFSLRCIKD